MSGIGIATIVVASLCAAAGSMLANYMFNRKAREQRRQQREIRREIEELMREADDIAALAKKIDDERRANSHE